MAWETDKAIEGLFAFARRVRPRTSAVRYITCILVD